MVALSRKELYRKQLRYSITKKIVDGSIFAGIFFLVCDRWVYQLTKLYQSSSCANDLFISGAKYLAFWLLGLLLAACVLLLISNYLCSGKDIFANAGFDKKRVRAVIEKIWR